jgi:transposase
MRYIGLDLHKEACQATVLDESGKVLQETRFASNREELARFCKPYKGARIVLEAVGFYEWVWEELLKHGLQPTLAHPTKVRAIADAKIKTDKIDAKILAHLLRTDLLPEAYVPVPEMRRLRQLVRERVHLTRMMTKEKVRVRWEIMRRGIATKEGDPSTIAGRQWLEKQRINAVDRALAHLHYLENEQKELDEEIVQATNHRKEIGLLRTIPGMGPFLSVLVASTIADINRFPDPDKLAAYAGMVPSTHQSGSSQGYHGHITKEGPKLLRWGLVQATWVHLQRAPTSSLSKFHARIARRRGRQKATIATARKLLRVAYWVIRDGEPYHSQGHRPRHFREGQPRVE